MWTFLKDKYSTIQLTETFYFPGGSDGKASAYNAGDPGSVPELERSPGEGNGNPLWYSCLENPMDRGAWQATVHGVAKSQTQLSNFTLTINSWLNSSIQNWENWEVTVEIWAYWNQSPADAKGEFYMTFFTAWGISILSLHIVPGSTV